MRLKQQLFDEQGVNFWAENKKAVLWRKSIDGHMIKRHKIILDTELFQEIKKAKLIKVLCQKTSVMEILKKIVNSSSHKQ
jgi:hypothetical protein